MPMDRLICGDVGYGKTEIAVRAAFKAVQDGKQVAVLVPTTLLAQQHFQTFSEPDEPVPVDCQRGFRGSPTTPTRSRRSAGLRRRQRRHRDRHPSAAAADGAVQDLGLVIVDEEQRFGVEHKEYLKTLRTAVDVLTMSATPIPRTLEMTLTGIREMSTILTPPEERHPILTFVGAYDPRQIAAAIRRELLRDGQVFFIHNRISSINKAAGAIAELVPEARIAVAHGQMGEDALEKVMVGFWEKDFDVLVCTTIVESGLDIPERQHPDRRAGRHLRAVPAAPDARPGRPRPGAGVRVLPLPAGEAAHRDRARPAGHHRPAHRPRRRHAGGDEGPGDPRRRQPAGWRAVRPHRRRRLRPLRPAGRRGGGRVSRRPRRSSSSR